MNSNFIFRSFTKNFIILCLLLFTFSCSTNDESGPTKIASKEKPLSFEATLRRINFNLNDPTEAYMNAALKISNTLRNKLNGLSRPARTINLKRIQELTANASENNSKELAILMGYNNQEEFTQAITNLTKLKNNFLSRNSKFNNLDILQKKEFMKQVLVKKISQTNPALRITEDDLTEQDCEIEAIAGYTLAASSYLYEVSRCEALAHPETIEACASEANMHYAIACIEIEHALAACLAEVAEAEKKKKD